jgi:hypothetical protein
MKMRYYSLEAHCWFLAVNQLGSRYAPCYADRYLLQSAARLFSLWSSPVYLMMCMLGVGASTPWEESNNCTRLLEWFAWSEVTKIKIEYVHSHDSICIARWFYAMLYCHKFFVVVIDYNTILRTLQGWLLWRNYSWICHSSWFPPYLIFLLANWFTLYLPCASVLLSSDIVFREEYIV